MALVVNGERVEDSTIQNEIERLRPRYEQVFADKDPQEREAQLRDWSKENVIERVLLNQQAKKDNKQVPSEKIEDTLAKLKQQYQDPQELYKDLDVENDQKLKETIELQMRVDRKLSEIYKNLPEPTQDQIRQYYQENKEQFQSTEQVRVAHIVKYVNWQTDEASALEIMTKAQDELKNGIPFEVVVDKFTDCADSGGDLGYVSRGQMVEEFEDVVFNLGLGQTSDIFRTRFGLHIAKLYDRRPPAIQPLEQVQKHIKDQLSEQFKENALADYLDQLRSTAKIEDI